MARWQLSQEFETLALFPGGCVTSLETGNLSHTGSIMMGIGSTDTPCGLLGVKVKGLLDLCVLLARDAGPHDDHSFRVILHPGGGYLIHSGSSPQVALLDALSSIILSDQQLLSGT